MSPSADSFTLPVEKCAALNQKNYTRADIMMGRKLTENIIPREPTVSRPAHFRKRRTHIFERLLALALSLAFFPVCKTV